MTVYEQRLLDLFITAFEGGSGYWAQIRANLTQEQRDQMRSKGQSLSEYIFDKVYNEGAEFKVWDAEEPTEELGVINKINLKRGYTLLKADHEEHFADVITENYDAVTADIYFQLAILGEITFG